MTMAIGLRRKHALHLCIAAVTYVFISCKIGLEGQHLSIQAYLEDATITFPNMTIVIKESVRSSSFLVEENDQRERVNLSQQCPGIPEAPKNATLPWALPFLTTTGRLPRRASMENDMITSTFDRPSELEELLSTPRMKMPSAHNITGLRIAFVGDSVTRYQMTTLAFYLRYGQWLSDAAQPNVLSKLSFDSWDDFASYSVDLFGREPYRYPCDCFGPNKKVIFYDNRYYQDTCRDNYISFISKLGRRPTRGHWHPHETFRRPASVYANMTLLNSPEPLWQYHNWPDLLRNYITRLVPKPDYLVINEGLWRKHGFHSVVDERNGTTIFHEIRRILDEHNIHGIYKTTTMDMSTHDATLEPHDEVGCEVLHSCLLMNWTAASLHGETHYSDSKHFRPHVNRWFVEQIWDHLAQLESERQQVIETERP